MDFQTGTGYSVGWFTLALINAGPIATLFIAGWPEGDWKQKRARFRPVSNHSEN